MAKANVKLDYKELQKLREQLDKVANESQVDEFLKSCSKELAARLLAKVIKRTPSVDGVLRRGWTGEKSGDATKYAQSLPVSKEGSDFVIEIINPVYYASYVEFGHRQEVGRFVPAIGKRLKKGWVEGKFMLTISEEEIRKSAPKILEKKLEKYLKECFS